jgi:hypothetical protein
LQMQHLYQIEARLREARAGPLEARSLRQEQSVPILARINPDNVPRRVPSRDGVIQAAIAPERACLPLIACDCSSTGCHVNQPGIFVAQRRSPELPASRLVDMNPWGYEQTCTSPYTPVAY